MATALPKVELHCHLKGSIMPALARRLAARHGVQLGNLISPDGRYAWKDFAGFLEAYDAVAALVRQPEDYRTVVRDYYRRSALQGLIYSEMFVSPAHAARTGISYATLIDTVADAMRSAEAEFGIVARIIVICVRHWGAENAEETARLAQKSPHPYVVGFGMGGDEGYGSPGDFAPAFEIARGAGLRLTAHAGEIGGPGSICGALRDLKVERLGHGVRSIEDAALLTELKERGTFLEVCPGSNIAIGLYPSYAAHPVARFAALGLKVGLSTDDPGFFADTIGVEYDAVADALDLTQVQMLAFSRMSLEAAFCDDATKADLIARLKAWTP